MRGLVPGAVLVLVPILAAGGANAAFPGRNGLIAFVRSPVAADGALSDADVYTMQPDGSQMRDVTPGPPGVFEDSPAWSPDGRVLLYVSRSGTSPPRIVAAAPDGSRPRTLTAGDLPSFSPDGTRIVFERGPEIWVARDDGRNARRLTAPGTGEAYSDPAWSPDGRTIAFFRASAKPAREGLFFIHPDGRGLRRAGAAALGPSLAWTPAGRLSTDRGWSPDGRYVATAESVDDSDVRTDVFRTRPDGSQPVRLTFSAATETSYDPVWQPLCTIRGTPRADVLVGGPGSDVICGLGGNDRIRAGGGNDTVIGGDGNDTIVGGPGRDNLFGGRGDDTILARDGRPDVVDGGPGRDHLVVDRLLDRLTP